MQKKILITNLVYGPDYSDIFLEFHLKSMLDLSNIPSVRDRVEYAIYTDASSLNTLRNHPNVNLLDKFCPLTFHVLNFDEGRDAFGDRYSALVHSFKMGVARALEQDMLMSAMCADLVVAKDFLPRVLGQIDKGFDSVFVLPMRTALEAMGRVMKDIPDALSDLDLFNLGYANLHPLWVACHYNAPQFTKMPFTLLWNTGRGLLARSFSITPIVFTPTKPMLEATGVIDAEIPFMCKNPFWAENWVDAPIIGVEPLQCYYPPFQNGPLDFKPLVEFGGQLHFSQREFLDVHLWYPYIDFSYSTLQSDIQIQDIRDGMRMLLD